MIFVFGSNTAGFHGAGAAKFAVDNEGAVNGQGQGQQGNSYAIPTRRVDSTGRGRYIIVDLPLDEVAKYVKSFIRYAQRHLELEFKVTQIGTGYAGFTADQIANLFNAAPDNCYFDEAWAGVMSGKKYWGTYTSVPVVPFGPTTVIDVDLADVEMD